ncbi:hypothetical protein MTO96_029441 [Rhipicephalus appendiculatus]
MRPQRQVEVAQPVVGGERGAAASSGPSALCIIFTMMISMIVASVLTFFIINKNRTINDTGSLDDAEEDRVTSGDEESAVTQDT